MSAIAGTVVIAGRGDVQLASNLRQAAEAEAAADGAVQLVGFRLLDRARALPLDGRRVPADRGGDRIGVCVADEAGKVNPNTANAALLTALLQLHGAERAVAERLAIAIVAWRTPGDPSPAVLDAYAAAGRHYAPAGKPFGALEELRLVLGMTPALYAAAEPDLSVWNGGDPDPAVASPAVRQAVRAVAGFEPAPRLADPTAPITVSVVAEAETPGGGTFTRRATLRVAPGGDPPMRILAWSRGGAC